ncbi:zf-HC2 domain-containing protein [Pseudonocardia acaciae]|uniref:zf-HC2 domain-containing protein n=1 Tax=Pseudonocardia acaciae TaxID=551276 RepID=UPI0007E8DE31|nr:zf-HC2 domain-containing protein [Pseudonocardia acaciae]
MTELRGQSPTGPAWGGGHLAMDAIVAYVDEELSPGARRRALEHLARCAQCASEVVAQTQARWALRASSAPSLPSSLLTSLRAIPQEAELPAPPAGLAVGPDGQLVSMLREPGRRGDRRRQTRVVRLGAGAVVSGLALGALMVGADPAAPTVPPPTASFGGAVPVGDLSRPTAESRAGIGAPTGDPWRPVPTAAVLAPAPAALAPPAAPPPPTDAAAVRHLHR